MVKKNIEIIYKNIYIINKNNKNNKKIYIVNNNIYY